MERNYTIPRKGQQTSGYSFLLLFSVLEVLFCLISLETILVSFNAPIMAAQDLTITFAAIFALVAAIYIKKMFDNMLGE